MKPNEYPTRNFDTNLIPAYRYALSELTKIWRGGKHFHRVGPHPLEDVARECVALLLQKSPVSQAGTSLEAQVASHLDTALFCCCEQNKSIAWYWTHAEAEAAVRRRCVYGDRTPGSSYREMMDRVADDVMRRQNSGLKIVQMYRLRVDSASSTIPPQPLPPFLAYMRTAINHATVDVLRTRRGEDFWHDVSSLEPSADDDRPHTPILAGEVDLTDALKWLARQRRSAAALKVLQLLEDEILQMDNLDHRARLQAWLTWMRQTELSSDLMDDIPANRKALAELLGCTETALNVNIFRFKENFLKKYEAELKLALTSSVGS